MSKRRKNDVRIAVAVVFVLLASIFSLLAQDAYSHGIPAGGVSRFFRVDNEQFSANNVIVGITIEVKVELESLVNRDIPISQALIAVSETSPANAQEFSRNYTTASSEQWHIVNATHMEDFVLAAGQTMPFSMNITALESGSYHLHSAFAWSYVAANGTQIDTTYYGRGATIQVALGEGLLQRCSELGIEGEKCSQEAILGRECLGMNCGGTGTSQMDLLQNPTMLALFGLLAAGIGGAGALFYIKSRRVKRQNMEG